MAPHPFSLQQFIDKSISTHGDYYNYSKVSVSSRHDTVSIICPVHGLFETIAVDHYRGSKRGMCPVCHPIRSYNTTGRYGWKGNGRIFIEDAQALFGDFYDYSLVPSDITSTTKVSIICPEHGVFEQTAHIHLRGSRCPQCAREKNARKRMLSQEEYIERVRSVHKDHYDLSETVYNGGDRKLKVICPDHGEFSIRAKNFARGQGCRECRLGPLT